MADAFSSIASGLGSLGSAVSDLFGAQGSADAVSSFEQAAQIATQNEGLAQQATTIQKIQENRTIQGVLGTQKAQVGGAGFLESGSALSLLASSSQQGALTTALTGIQGQITANGYAQQAAAYTAQAESAAAAEKAQSAGGLLSGLGGIASIATGAWNLL